ncbi:MAG: hypothetical protein K8R69_07690 [Deltaproteobacteria bacterium]|nr:hypothetical protein [Deltaproteobacteria bacterium]
MQHALRATQTWELLLNLWPTPRPLVSEDIVRALESLYDPMATDLARAIRHRDFTLRIVDDAEFNRLVRQISGDERGEFWSGFTVRGDPYFYPMDTITIRQIQNVSGAVFPELVFERLVTLIHEYEHHLHRSLADSPQISQLNEEMSAHLRHLHFRSRQGFTESIDDILKVSPLGLGMYLRDRIESSYLQRSLAPRVRSLEPLDSSEGARRERIEDSAHYSRGLLDLSLDRLLAVLRRGTTAGEDRGPVRDWLMEARRVLEEQRKDLGEWIESKEGVPTPYLEAASYRYVDFARVWEQLTETLNLLAEEPSTAKLSLIRRRLDWVLYDGGHGRAWDWNEVPWFLRLTETTPPAEDRLAYGRHLLERFHPNPTSEDFDLLEAAAGGPIRGRDIAFDLDDTLGDTVARHVAEKIHGLDPGRYDQDPRESVHQLQRVRAVYRHMQALLLGLWASGNRLRLFTASDNYAGNHDAFFNDYPALKVAFGLASPEGPEVLLRSADLDQSPHFMDRLKYQRRYAELFSGESGRRFLQNVRTERSLGESRGFRSAKLPTPGFPFEVLVDDLQGFGVELREAGFGERWVRAQGNGLRQWSSLVEFFSSPREPAMDLWNRWLSEEYEE